MGMQFDDNLSSIEGTYSLRDSIAAVGFKTMGMQFDDNSSNIVKRLLKGIHLTYHIIF